MCSRIKAQGTTDYVITHRPELPRWQHLRNGSGADINCAYRVSISSSDAKPFREVQIVCMPANPYMGKIWVVTTMKSALKPALPHGERSVLFSKECSAISMLQELFPCRSWVPLASRQIQGSPLASSVPSRTCWSCKAGKHWTSILDVPWFPLKNVELLFIDFKNELDILLC